MVLGMPESEAGDPGSGVEIPSVEQQQSICHIGLIPSQFAGSALGGWGVCSSSTSVGTLTGMQAQVASKLQACYIL
jgi:hypothetical protein